MSIKVAKFGGSSLADAAKIRNAIAIIEADPTRRYVVASAPGKRHNADVKITDLLYRLYDQRHGDYSQTISTIRQRFEEIAAELEVSVDLATEFTKIEHQLTSGVGVDYFASRGEYLNSLLLATRLGWPLIDAAQIVRFDETGVFQAVETDQLMKTGLTCENRAVIPGFYGSTASGVVRTFSRGGSDVTGALVARAVGADVYENWTDVSGILMADPRIVASPKAIERISYTALRGLAYLGASVLHEDAINPVREKSIPINIRNTNRPSDEGTWIQGENPQFDSSHPAIIGLAAKTGYAAVTIKKAQMSGGPGCARLLGLFDQTGVVVELALGSVDTWLVVVRVEPTQLDQIVANIGSAFHPDAVTVRSCLALVGIVESGTIPRGCVVATLSRALVEANIEVHLLDSGAGDMHIIAIDEENHPEAIKAIYQAFTN